MLYGKIEALIEAHLKSNSKKILLVDDAKQVGKTYIIRYVGQRLFENFIETNMVEDFEGNRRRWKKRHRDRSYLQRFAAARIAAPSEHTPVRTAHTF